MITNKKLLVAVSIFLFFVFAGITPFDLSYAEKGYLEGGPSGADAAASMVEKGNPLRQVSLIALAGFALIILWRSNWENIRIKNALGCLIIFFIFFATISIFWSDDPGLTFRRVIVLYILWLGAIAIASRFSILDTVLIVYYVCILTLLFCIGIEFYFHNFDPFSEIYRLSGGLHPMNLAMHCSLLSITSYFLLQQVKSIKSIYFITLIIGIVSLLLTKSRGPFITTIAIITVSMFISMGSLKKLFIFGLIVILGISFFAYVDKETSYSGLFTFGRGAEGTESADSLSGRTILWQVCLSYFAKKPYIGYGYESFWTSKHILTISKLWPNYIMQAHSVYIQTLLNLGIVGGFTIIMIIIYAIKESLEFNGFYVQSFMFYMIIFFSILMNLEASLLFQPFFPSFLFMIILAKLGFIEPIIQQSIE